jgi:hypothetical protein
MRSYNYFFFVEVMIESKKFQIKILEKKQKLIYYL